MSVLILIAIHVFFYVQVSVALRRLSFEYIGGSSSLAVYLAASYSTHYC